MPSISPFQLLQDIDRRCRAQARLPEATQAEPNWSGVGFRLAGLQLVAPMGEVAEVLHEPRQTQLPGVKPWVLGVANVRGRLLPIIDLCRFVGREPSPRRKERRVLVVEFGEIFSGLLVDELLGMQHFPRSAFRAQSQAADAALQPFLCGTFEQAQAWQVFSPHILAQHQAFLDVAA